MILLSQFGLNKFKNYKVRDNEEHKLVVVNNVWPLLNCFCKLYNILLFTIFSKFIYRVSLPTFKSFDRQPSSRRRGSKFSFLPSCFHNYHDLEPLYKVCREESHRSNHECKSKSLEDTATQREREKRERERQRRLHTCVQESRDLAKWMRSFLLNFFFFFFFFSS